MNNEISEIENDKLVIELNGEKKECDVLFTYDSPDVDYTYVAFTDNSKDKNGNLVIMFAKASEFTDMNYIPVTEQEELDMLEEVLKDILKNYQNN